MTLAIHGGKPLIKEPLRPYNTIGSHEVHAAIDAIRGGPLSGFLGGELHGGKWVRMLEEAWADKFGVKHAVSMNSATSGLMAAFDTQSKAVPSTVHCPALTMSATAIAAPAAHPIVFHDVETEQFSFGQMHWEDNDTKHIFTPVNLFGHPSSLAHMRKWCDETNGLMIEDNAQSILAREDGRYAGTIGHIGVFSLNVHKHIQSGEGGIVVTNDDAMANDLRMYRNHGELNPSARQIGCNLRMTEVTAAIAYAQFKRVEEIVAGRIAQAEAITRMVKDISFITPAKVREGCTHVYYHWPFTFDAEKAGVHRDVFVEAVRAEGLPLEGGYVQPLHRLPVFEGEFSDDQFPNAIRLHEHTLGYFSNCQYDPTPDQLRLMGDVFQKVAENIGRLR